MPKHEITLSQAIEGYFIYANARRLSPHTLDNYHWALRKLEAYLESDPALASITTADIRAFVNNLPSLSNKSIINVRSGLSALWTWALREGLAPRNIIKDTQAPKPEKRAIVPFTQRDIQVLLVTGPSSCSCSTQASAPLSSAPSLSGTPTSRPTTSSSLARATSSATSPSRRGPSKLSGTT